MYAKDVVIDGKYKKNELNRSFYIVFLLYELKYLILRRIKIGLIVKVNSTLKNKVEFSLTNFLVICY